MQLVIHRNEMYHTQYTYPYTILLVNQVIILQLWSPDVYQILCCWFNFCTWWWLRNFFHKLQFSLLWIFNFYTIPS